MFARPEEEPSAPEVTVARGRVSARKRRTRRGGQVPACAAKAKAPRRRVGAAGYTTEEEKMQDLLDPLDLIERGGAACDVEECVAAVQVGLARALAGTA